MGAIPSVSTIDSRKTGNDGGGKGVLLFSLLREVLTTSEAYWEIPEPLSTHEVRMDDGAVVILRRHGNPEGPRLVLSHGNGLAIDLYYPFWSLLTAEFDLIVHDLRNHGWNPVSAQENHSVPSFVSDHDRILEEIDLQCGKKPKTGVYHSVSAVTSLLSPTRCRGYEGLVLFDPPLCKPGSTYWEFDEASTRVARMVRNRVTHFQTREEFIDILSLLSPFYRSVPGVFDLVSRTTLRPSEDAQGYELRCPAVYEAQIVDYCSVFGVSVNFPALQCPVKVIGADPTLPYAYLPTFDLKYLLGLDYDFLPESTHFLQLEKPEECVAAMREFLEQAGAV